MVKGGRFHHCGSNVEASERGAVIHYQLSVLVFLLWQASPNVAEWASEQSSNLALASERSSSERLARVG